MGANALARRLHHAKPPAYTPPTPTPPVVLPNLSAPTLSPASPNVDEGTAAGVTIATVGNQQGAVLSLTDNYFGRYAFSNPNVTSGSGGIPGPDSPNNITIRLTKAGYANSPLDTVFSIIVNPVAGESTRVAGPAFTPTYVPTWSTTTGIPLYKTRAALLSGQGLSSGAVLDMAAYASPEACFDAAVAAGKAVSIGTDNGAYTATTTRRWVTFEGKIYGYGSAFPTITGATRLDGWIVTDRFKITMRDVKFVNFGFIVAYPPGTLPLARPDDKGYDAATTATVRAPYHTSTDKLVVACEAANDAGFIMRRCGSINVTGSPNIASIIPERQLNDGGPGGTRIAYGYKGNEIYSDLTFTGQALWYAALDHSALNLLASGLPSATNASLVSAINAISSETDFSAVLDPDTGYCVILSSQPDNRPLRLLVQYTSGTVTTDTNGVDVDISYCSFTGCDKVIGGIGDVTSAGRIDFHKNIGRATWGQVSLTFTRWWRIYSADNDWQDCLQSGGVTGTAAGRTSANGNAMPAGSNQSPNNTLLLIGKDSVVHMRYMKLYPPQCHVENNQAINFQSLANTDTVNAAVYMDIRLCWGGYTNFSWSYNYIENFKAINGAIDCNVLYAKTDSFYAVGNVLKGFGAKRVGFYRPLTTGTGGSGSEGSGFLFKNNGSYGDTSATVYIGFNYFEGAPNGIAIIKWEDKLGSVIVDNNHIKGWTNQLDDPTLGDATGRAVTLGVFTGSTSGTTLTVSSMTSGVLQIGMTINNGTTQAVIAKQLTGTTGAAGTYQLDRSLTASGTWTANYHNIVDGALIRGFEFQGPLGITSNFFENVNDQGFGDSINFHAVSTRSGTQTWTGQIAGSKLTVTAQPNILLQPGDVLAGTNVTSGTSILSQDSGTPGGNGVYSLDRSSTAASTTITSYTPYTKNASQWEISNNIARNDNSTGYPAYTAATQLMVMDGGGNLGSFSTVIMGFNKVQNASGAAVGNLNLKFGSVYSDNGNATSKPYQTTP